MPATERGSTWLARVKATLFWSVIAAAFVGPGTVTTAAIAGSSYRMALLWALVFSVVATIALQEAAARVTQASGLSLGQLIAIRYAERGRWLRWLLFGAIALGCGAYEAGNLLGALAGIRLLAPAASYWAVALALVAGALLWSGHYGRITTLLGIAVGLMGLSFAWVALGSPVQATDWLAGLKPSLPAGSHLLVVGLIGTTIVPYNLFLASGLRHRQSLTDMRWGIALSVLIGGGITLAILLAGTQVSGTFSFEALSAAVALRLGPAGPALFALGLFAAGFTSAITAPLAAAVTAQSLLAGDDADAWHSRSRYFRLIWMLILGVGACLAWWDVQPIPAIIAAQAINGMILPLAASFLLLAVNDRRLLPATAVNGRYNNLFMLVVVMLVTFLGLHQLMLALAKIEPALNEVQAGLRYGINAAIALVVGGWLAWKIRPETIA